MIQINLSALQNEDLYPRVLQVIEDVCEDYNLNKEFGFISTACQEVVEHLLGMQKPFSVDLDINIENTEITFLFSSTDPVFQDLMEHYNEENIIKDLSDRVDISPENKEVSLTFHVKTHCDVARTLTQREAVLKQEQRTHL